MAQIIEIEEEFILLTRQHFINAHLKCIKEASEGLFRVNDLEDFIEWQQTLIDDLKTGKEDHTLTFKQYAVYLQTGVCHSLLEISKLNFES